MVLPVLARRLEPADLGWATALLEASCATHPVLRYCCAGPGHPARRTWLLAQLLRFGLRFGRVYGSAEGNALAVWLGPRHPVATLGQLLQAGLLPAVWWRFGWAGFQRLRLVRRRMMELRRQSALANHHYYLLALVVSPGSRGRGVGRRLLQATLAAMQTAATPCFLDTQQPAQLIFFHRLGFRVVGQCRVGPGAGAPTNWAMMRP